MSVTPRFSLVSTCQPQKKQLTIHDIIKSKIEVIQKGILLPTSTSFSQARQGLKILTELLDNQGKEELLQNLNQCIEDKDALDYTAKTRIEYSEEVKAIETRIEEIKQELLSIPNNYVSNLSKTKN